MTLGHAFAPVVEAIAGVARNSASFGASTAKAEADLAERIVACYPAIEKMRFCKRSGTEATMSAIRLARAATGRKIIVRKFEQAAITVSCGRPAGEGGVGAYDVWDSRVGGRAGGDCGAGRMRCPITDIAAVEASPMRIPTRLRL